MKGNILPIEAWRMLESIENCVIVDVRTMPEWTFVGYPDLSSVHKDPIFLAWRIYPSMALNVGFEDELMKQVPDKKTPILFLCRSGGRSHDAAEAMAAQGYESCYNIEDGFEGEINERGHRGQKAGWKFENLPWRQQ